jgi:hypothetical protein
MSRTHILLVAACLAAGCAIFASFEEASARGFRGGYSRGVQPARSARAPQMRVRRASPRLARSAAPVRRATNPRVGRSALTKRVGPPLRRQAVPQRPKVYANKNMNPPASAGQPNPPRSPGATPPKTKPPKTKPPKLPPITVSTPKLVPPGITLVTPRLVPPSITVVTPRIVPPNVTVVTPRLVPPPATASPPPPRPVVDCNVEQRMVAVATANLTKAQTDAQWAQYMLEQAQGPFRLAKARYENNKCDFENRGSPTCDALKAAYDAELGQYRAKETALAAANRRVANWQIYLGQANAALNNCRSANW